MDPVETRFRLYPSAALLPPLAAILIQWAAWSAIRPYVWFLIYPALFFATWIGGLRWGIIATVLSASTVWWVFILPESHATAGFPPGLFSVAVFIATGVLFSVFHERLRKARRDAMVRMREMETFKAQFLSTMLGQINRGHARYQGLFEHLSSGFAHCSLLLEDDGSVDFVYLAVNPAFVKLTGLEAVAGKRISTLLPGVAAANPVLFQAYERVARTGVSERVDTFVEALGVGLSINIYCPAQGEFIALFDLAAAPMRGEAGALAETSA